MTALLGQAVDRLHVGRLRLAHAHLAEVEQRHLQLDLEAALAPAGAVSCPWCLFA